MNRRDWRKRKGRSSTGGISAATRYAIYHRDGFRCVYCKMLSNLRGDELSLDHVVPRYKGGSGRPDNLVTACRRCNSVKRAGVALGKPRWQQRVRNALRKSLNREVGQLLAVLYKAVRPSKQLKRLTALIPPPF